MRILILGGTIFVGRHLVDAATRSGHTVTIFHRGKHNPGLFAGDIETVIGDRTNADDLQRLVTGRSWDIVIDTCGYVPRIVRMTAEALKDSVARYCFVSTVSVYADWSLPLLTEDAALATIDDPEIEEVTGETYGGLKTLCEAVVREIYGPERTLLIRPGLIVGPHDPTDRFTYWPHRVALGGEVLYPHGESVYAQFIDVRDLAEWTLRLVETARTGIYNANGLPIAFEDLLTTCMNVIGGDVTLVPVPEPFLVTEDVTPWSELPLWIPRSMNHAALIDIKRATDEGLTLRPISDIIADTLAWDKARPESDTAFRGTLTLEKEAQIIGRFKQQQDHG